MPAPQSAKNVLFIICDDMRPQLGAYGHSFMHTPHIDQLAATGTLFNKAYVQYSFCAPSRNSFMRSVLRNQQSLLSRCIEAKPMVDH